MYHVEKHLRLYKGKAVEDTFSFHLQIYPSMKWLRVAEMNWATSHVTKLNWILYSGEALALAWPRSNLGNSIFDPFIAKMVQHLSIHFPRVFLSLSCFHYLVYLTVTRLACFYFLQNRPTFFYFLHDFWFLLFLTEFYIRLDSCFNSNLM